MRLPPRPCEAANADERRMIANPMFLLGSWRHQLGIKAVLSTQSPGPLPGIGQRCLLATTTDVGGGGESAKRSMGPTSSQ